MGDRYPTLPCPCATKYDFVPSVPRAQNRLSTLWRTCGSGLSALTGAALEAALAGILVGVFDLALIASRSSLRADELPVSSGIVVGLAVALVGVVGTPLVLLVRLLCQHPLLRAIAHRLLEPGPRRVETLVLGASGIAPVALVWWFGYRAVAHVHRLYQDAGAAGLMASTMIVVVALAVGIATCALAPPLARRVAARPRAVQLTSGLALAGLAAAVAIGGAALLHAAVGIMAPAWDPLPAYVLASAPLAVIGGALLAPARRLGRGRAAGALAACVAVIGFALAGIGTAGRTRAALIATGAVSSLSLHQLQALADGDHDGYADALGGGDCDDHDPAIHPGAREIAGNGLDDNCMGGDAPLAETARRRVAQASAHPSAARRDIILITMDAARADHTSAYGYRRATTPNLAALAARGSRFALAESPSPLTRRALPSMLFGRYASTLPYRDTDAMPEIDDNELPTLASTLRDAGWTTQAILSNHGLLGPPALTGFEDTIAVSHDPVNENKDNAADVTSRALEWIAGRPADRPYFLWIHYIDPHYPYAPAPGAPHYGDGTIDAYDAEIASTDAQIGRLLANLAAAGRADRTIVAVTADHGEAFGEHGEHYHGSTLYEEQTHIPLVIAVPGAAPRVIREPMSLVDVAPTLLDLVGVAAPAGMNGVSAAAAVDDGAALPRHAVLAELLRDRQVRRRLVAIYRGDTKLIRDLQSSTSEVYELDRDPGELHDQSDRSVAGVLERSLARAADDELSEIPPPRPPVTAR